MDDAIQKMTDALNANRPLEAIAALEARKSVESMLVIDQELHFLTLASLYLSVEQFERAFEAVERGMRLQPNSGKLHLLRIGALVAGDNPNDAIPELLVASQKRLDSDDLKAARQYVKQLQNLIEDDREQQSLSNLAGAFRTRRHKARA